MSSALLNVTIGQADSPLRPIRKANVKARRIHLAILSAAVFAVTTYAGSSSSNIAHGDVIVKWTFESDTIATTGGSSSLYAPETNPGSVMANGSGVHVTSATAYSSPSGNGSVKSFSSNMWKPNDYWEFDVDTSAFTGVGLSFDAVGSATGPKDFELEVNTGAGFNNFGSYTLTSSPTWISSAASTLAGQSYSFDLSSLTGVTGVRLVDLDTTNIGGSSGGTVGTAGTSRVDNVTFSGTPASVPEPASVAILGAGAAFLLGRRRR